jgi:hypothetical protein
MGFYDLFFGSDITLYVMEFSVQHRFRRSGVHPIPAPVPDLCACLERVLLSAQKREEAEHEEADCEETRCP